MERYTKYLDFANSVAKSTEIPTRLQIIHNFYREWFLLQKNLKTFVFNVANCMKCVGFEIFVRYV